MKRLHLFGITWSRKFFHRSDVVGGRGETISADGIVGQTLVDSHIPSRILIVHLFT